MGFPDMKEILSIESYLKETTLPSVYGNLKLEVTNALNYTEFFGVTCNLWSTKNQKRHYFGLTVHYLDNNWTMKNFSLGLYYMKGRKTSERIRKLVDRVIKEFLPDNSKIGFTTDNGYNIVAALSNRDHVRW